MSWSEVYKINNNMKRSINEQLRDLKFQEIKIITSSGTYTPLKTGLYKVICVGAGGNGGYSKTPTAKGGGAGGGGGVAISTLSLSSSVSYTVTVNGAASFVYNDNITLKANAGGDGTTVGGSGGTASGGDNNYAGTRGSYTSDVNVVPQAGGVSVHIPELSYTPAPIFGTLSTFGTSDMPSTYAFSLNYGECLLGYGGGGTATSCSASTGSSYSKTSSSGRPAAIIIVPLEMEE